LAIVCLGYGQAESHYEGKYLSGMKDTG